MIEVFELTKRYGRANAVDGLSFVVEPGHVTGFLGPNGAGKSTTMRMILGLDAPTGGQALVDGKPYSTLIHPQHIVGALLDANAVHGGRTARAHLYGIARSNGISAARVAAVLETVGLSGVAQRRIAGFSLGMKQRLGIAGALLGDPQILLFDEPVNGLDPEGVRWIRALLKSLAAEGRTVLVSSHMMSEMALTADHVLMIGRGRLIEDTTVDELQSRFHRGVHLRSPRETELARALTEALTATVAFEPGGGLSVSGADAAAIGDLAAAHGIPLHQLISQSASLEEAFMELADDSVVYRADAPATLGQDTPR
jgi:ABC-2 type transport system ATP-binding protein